MSTKNRLMAIAVASCAAFGSSAYAVDLKVMPGSACQPSFPVDRENIFAFVDAGVMNMNKTDPAFVLCPIVRDNTSPNPNGVLRVRLLVKESSNGERVSCLLDSRDDDGTKIQRDEPATSNSNGVLNLTVKQNPESDGYYMWFYASYPRAIPGAESLVIDTPRRHRPTKITKH